MDGKDNLIPFKPGESGNPNGRPVGAKNRSTIARKILEMKYLFTDENFDKLKKQYPEIERAMTVEEIMTIVQVNNAVSGDDKSYKAIMDSAYGAPKQETEGKMDVTLTNFSIKDVLDFDNPQSEV